MTTLPEVLRALENAKRKGATKDVAILERLAQRLALAAPLEQEAPPVAVDYRDLPVSSLIAGGARRAFSGLGSLATDVLPATFGSLFGFEDYAREQMEEAKAKRQAAERESPTAFRSYTDIRGLGDVIGFGAETLGEASVDLASLLVPGGVGSVVGRRLAQRGAAKAGEEIAERLSAREAARLGPAEYGPLSKAATDKLAESAARMEATAARRYGAAAGDVGARRGFTAGVGVGGYALGTGEIFESVYNETGELAPELSLALGVPFAALDSVLPLALARQLGGTGKTLLAKEMLERSTLPEAKGLARRLMVSLPSIVAKEGLTEAAQENITILAEQIAGSSKDFFDPENVDRIITAGLKGGIAGGVLGTPTAVMEAARDKSADQALIDAERNRRQAVELEAQEAAARQAAFEKVPRGETAPLFSEEEAPIPKKAKPATEDLPALRARLAEVKQTITDILNPEPILELNEFGPGPVQLPTSPETKARLLAAGKEERALTKQIAEAEKEAAKEEKTTTQRLPPVFSPNLLVDMGVQKGSDLYKQFVNKPVELDSIETIRESLRDSLEAAMPLAQQRVAGKKLTKKEEALLSQGVKAQAALDSNFLLSIPTSQRELELPMAPEFALTPTPPMAPEFALTPTPPEAPTQKEVPLPPVVEPDARQGALQFAPPALEPTTIELALKKAQEQQARQERRKTLATTREADLERLSNVAAAQRQLDLIEPEAPITTPEPTGQLPLFTRKQAPFPRTPRSEAKERLPAPQLLITRDALDETGLPAQSGFYKRLVNRDLTKRGDRESVRSTLKSMRANDVLDPAVLRNVENLVFNQLAIQQELNFEQPNEPTGGTGPEVPSRPRRDTTPEGTPPPPPSGVAPPPVAPGQADVGAREPDVALTAPAEPPAEPPAPAEPSNLLDSSQYVFHAVRNDEDIAGIMRNGLKIGTNVSVDLNGQAFEGEGDTILVFRRDDVKAKLKEYQNDGLTSAVAKPIAILKDTSIEANTKTKNELEDEVLVAGDEFDKLVAYAQREHGMSEKEVIDYRVGNKKLSQAPFEARKTLERIRFLSKKIDSLLDASYTAPETSVSDADVLLRYKQYGTPVQAIKIEPTDDGSKVYLKQSLTDAPPAPAAPPAAPPAEPPAPKKELPSAPTPTETVKAKKKSPAAPAERTEVAAAPTKRGRPTAKTGSDEFKSLAPPKFGDPLSLQLGMQFQGFTSEGFVGHIPKNLNEEIEDKLASAEKRRASLQTPLETKEADEKIAALQANLNAVNADIEKIQNLLLAPAVPKDMAEGAKAAKLFFDRGRRLSDGLYLIAVHNVFESPTELKLPQADQYGSLVEANYFEGLTTDNAKQAEAWVLKNLSPSAKVAYSTYLAQQTNAAKTTDFELSRMMANGFAPQPDVILDAEGKPIPTDSVIKQYKEVYAKEWERMNKLNAALEQAGLSREDRRQVLGEASRRLTGDRVLDGTDLIRVLPEPSRKLLVNAVEALPANQRATLAKALGEKNSTSDSFLSKVLLQVTTLVNKGEAAVTSAIRGIIKGIARAIVAAGIVFSPQQLSPNFAYSPAQAQAEVQAERPQVKVPAEARQRMSDVAAQVYESMAPVAKQTGKGFMIADKPNGMLHVFNADGSLIAQDAALYGQDMGDALEGARKITPAGMYTLRKAPSGYAGGQAFELAETEHVHKDRGYVIAVHAAWLGDPKEKRAERLKSSAISDKRISYGCINTAHDTFLNKVLPNADNINGGMIFVIPDDTTFTESFLQQGVIPPPGVKPLQGPVLGQPLHPIIIRALENGDLTTALKGLAGYRGILGRMAGALVRANLTTKVQVVENLAEGVPGYFDPKTNTIYLDANTGLNSHVALHEALHAATAHVLANPSHPVTRQLNAIYQSVKGMLDTAYGATNLDEFVAEAFSNPEFQAKLQGMFPDGSPISAWAKFTRTIGNMFRTLLNRPTVPTTSAFEQVDYYVGQILSPAPEHRNAGALFAASISPKASNALLTSAIRAANKLPISENYKNNIDEFLRNTLSNTTRSFVLDFLTLPAVSDMASKYLPQAKQINTLINMHSGEEDKLFSELEVNIRRVENWARNNQNKLDAFNDLVYGSTLAKIDVAPKSNKRAAPKASDYAAQSQSEFIRLSALYNSLGAEGQQAYRDMRDVYAKLYEYIIAGLTGRIDDVVQDKAKAQSIKQSILLMLAEKGGIDPYFPLTREGAYWLSYETKDANGQVDFVVEAFKQQIARTKRIEELGAKAKDVREFSQLTELDYRRVPTSSFLKSVLDVVPESSKADVLKLFVETMPETAFAKSFQARKETSGFNKDAIGAFRKKAFATVKQVANLKYAAKLDAVITEMSEAVQKKQKTAAGDVVLETMYLDKLREHAKFTITPNSGLASSILSSMGFTWTLGFNISSGLLNLSQVPLIVAPYLGGQYGQGATAKAISKAYKLVLGSGLRHNQEAFIGAGEESRMGFFSIDNYDFSKANVPQEVKDLKILVQLAQAEGQLNRSQIYSLLDTHPTEGGRLSYKSFMSYAGIFMHHGERLNRQVSLIAAYNLELDRMRASKVPIDDAARTQAASKAIYLTELTNGSVAHGAAPLITQRSQLIRLAFMYKRYAVSMYYLLGKTAKSLGDPAARKTAFTQLAGIFGMVGLASGVQGLPIFGALALVHNLLKDDDDEPFEGEARKALGDIPFKGILNYTTGLEIASRVGLSDLIMRDVINETDKSRAVYLLEAFGGPVYGTFSRMGTALDHWKSGEVWRGTEMALPVSVSNIFRAYRFNAEGAKTLRGDPIVEDVSPWNSLAQLIGFAPAEYVKQQEINAILKGVEKAANKAKTQALRRYYLARTVGDTDAEEEALNTLYELDNKHAGLFAKGVKKAIESSMRQHKETTKDMYAGVALSKGMRDSLLDLAAEYED